MIGLGRVMHSLRICLLALAFSLRASQAHADVVTFELMGGSAVNLPSPLVVRQNGFPDIRVSGARYETRPFGSYPYYAWRLGLWDENSGWELEHIHHRLFLSNLPPEIAVFAIHYGYNYFLLGRAWKRRGFVYRVGAGPIVTNPENTVRGRVFRTRRDFLDSGNYFSGIGTRVGLGRELQLARHLFLVGEGSFTTGFAWSVPVADGSANVPNLAIHGHLGIGVRF